MITAAERFVADALPGLDLRARRALALTTLEGADRETVARETATTPDELAGVLADARKTVRAERAPLSAGGRCERTERLLSARLDGTLDRPGARRLDAHLARCPRCRAHAELLETSLTELRDAFVALLQTAPTPPRSLAAAAAPPALPPAPVAAAELVAAAEVALPAPTPAPAPAPAQRAPAAAQPTARAKTPERRRPAAPPLPALALVVALVALIAAAVAGMTALNPSSPERAPWAAPSAPDVRPPSLADQ